MVRRKASDAPPALSDDEKIVQEAHERFRRCEEYEGSARKLYVEDVKFANGDPDNRWQWDTDVSSARDGADRPCLTVNMVRQHNLNIINDAKQNKSAIKISPVGDGATKEAADVFEGVVRHIEYVSNAVDAYDRATQTQVEGGVGYWRVVTDYVDNDSFDQEIYIRPVRDPLTVIIDPDAQQADRSDAAFAFVFEDMPRSLFEATYPEYKDGSGPSTAATFGDSTWTTKDHVRVAEYWRKGEKRDRLVAFTGPHGRQTERVSKLGSELVKELLKDPSTKIRDVLDDAVEWFKIVGREIIDRGEWPGRFIPIVMVVGEETWIDGHYDRKGHTRAMKDSQRIYNFWNSSQAEHLALQTKTQWIVDLEGIEGHEEEWKDANVENYAYLPYRSKTEDGRQLAAPERNQPPEISSAYLQGMQLAATQLQQVSGQYESQLGQPGNERTGIAIQQRQRQGDRATYHYIDNLAVAIRFTGRILIDLIPKVYDTERVVRILAENGDESHVAIAPDAQTALTQTDSDAGGQMAKQMGLQAVDAIFNPNVGRYEVQSDVGPSWGTRRQETYNALTQIAQADPELMKVIGDILFKAADFPMAEDIAERMKRTIAPAILGEGPTPAEQQAQQAAQQAQAQAAAAQKLMLAMQDKLAASGLALRGKDEKRDIEAYRAETDRMTSLKAVIGDDPDSLKMVVRQLMIEALQTPLTPVVSDNAGDLAQQADGAPAPPSPPLAAAPATQPQPAGAPQ